MTSSPSNHMLAGTSSSMSSDSPSCVLCPAGDAQPIPQPYHSHNLQDLRSEGQDTGKAPGLNYRDCHTAHRPAQQELSISSSGGRLRRQAQLLCVVRTQLQRAAGALGCASPHAVCACVRTTVLPASTGSLSLRALGQPSRTCTSRSIAVVALTGLCLVGGWY